MLRDSLNFSFAKEAKWMVALSVLPLLIGLMIMLLVLLTIYVHWNY